MTKHEIAKRIAEETDLTQIQTKEIVQRVFDNIVDTLADGGKVEFREFGVFVLKVRKEKVGRNPNKPENSVVIPEHVTVKFKPGRMLKKRVFQISPDQVK